MSIILNYEDEQLFTRYFKKFILNILKAIKHLTPSNFISISKIKEKLVNSDDKRYAHFLINTISDCDVILIKILTRHYLDYSNLTLYPQEIIRIL